VVSPFPRKQPQTNLYVTPTRPTAGQGNIAEDGLLRPSSAPTNDLAQPIYYDGLLPSYPPLSEKERPFSRVRSPAPYASVTFSPSTVGSPHSPPYSTPSALTPHMKAVFFFSLYLRNSPFLTVVKFPCPLVRNRFFTPPVRIQISFGFLFLSLNPRPPPLLLLSWWIDSRLFFFFARDR